MSDDSILSYAIALAFGAGVLALLIYGHLWYWRRRLAAPTQYARVQRVTTGDGVDIELRRLSDEVADSERPPVLLVHGIAANHRNVDPMPQLSLARHLSRAGRDVWLLTLRSALGRYRPFGDFRVGLGTMAEHDLPTAVEHVLQQTGARQVDVGAFSMGGMVLYAALGHALPEECVRRVVIYGAPGCIPPLGPLSWVRWLPRVLVPTVPLRLLAASIAFVHGLIPRFLLGVVYNPENCEREVAQRSLVELIVDVPGSLGTEFLRLARAGGELRVAGRSVLEGLSSLKVPVLFFAGQADRVAPAYCVRLAYDAWASAQSGVQKRYVLLGREQGARSDYGHGCLAIGRDAVEDVFEPSARFLAEI